MSVYRFVQSFFRHKVLNLGAESKRQLVTAMFYHPQRSCGKVMFLHLSFILSMRQRPPGQTPPGQTPPRQTPPGRHFPTFGRHLLGRHSPGQTPPPRADTHQAETSPLEADTPWVDTPSWADTPRQTPP